MDKIKENIFGIAVGATCLILLALIFFVVYKPLRALGAKQRDLDARIVTLKKYEKRKVPTKAYEEYLMRDKEEKEKSVADGGRFYEEKWKKFHEFFDEAVVAPALADFTTRYNVEIEKLVAAYRGKFSIKVDENQPEQTPPRISKVENIDDPKIPVAMKEYWIIKEIVDTLMSEKLEIGGLKSIDFPGRLLEPKDPPPYHRWVGPAVVLLEMPTSKLENLVSELFSRSRVPFQLESLEVKKSPELVGQFLSAERAKTYTDKNAHKANDEDYDSLVAEPNVIVELKLVALDWKGVPDESAGEPAGGETPRGQ